MSVWMRIVDSSLTVTRRCNIGSDVMFIGCCVVIRHSCVEPLRLFH